MIRALIRLGLAGGLVASLADRLLRIRAADGAPPPLEMLAVIDAPIDRVWAELIDIEGQPRWMHDMKSVRMDEPGPAREGATGTATVRMYGIAVEDPVTITEVQPPHRFSLAHEGIVAGGGTFVLERGADGTTTIVRWEERLRFPLLPHLGALLSAPVFRHVFQADIERLRAICEA
jgi:uncharacterized protein YndB with AHSA1/START domain